MIDVHTPEVRSYNMSRIRSVNTKPELIIRRFLFSKGLRYRIHDNRLPGKPDIYLPKYKTVIFVNGCFWHGHENCRYFVMPKTRADWWKSKIEKNKQNDALKHKQLELLEIRVITVWECQIKNITVFSSLLDQIYSNDR